MRELVQIHEIQRRSVLSISALSHTAAMMSTGARDKNKHYADKQIHSSVLLL